MIEWTRKDDVIIAEKCLGRKTRDSRSGYEMEHLERGGENGWDEWITIPFFGHDIGSALYAAESWRSKPGKMRTFALFSEDLEEGAVKAHLNECIDGHWHKWVGSAPSPDFALAISKALKKAVVDD